MGVPHFLRVSHDRRPLFPRSTLLQRNKSRTVRRADTRPAMFDGLIADAELAEVEADHLGLDLDLVELLARVDADHAPNHLRHHDHVPQVRLDQVRLLVRLSRLLRLAQLLDQPHRLTLQAPVETASGPRVYHVAELFGGEVEESVPGGVLFVSRSITRTATGDLLSAGSARRGKEETG